MNLKLQNLTLLEMIRQRIYGSNFIVSQNGGGALFRQRKNFSMEEKTSIVIEAQSGRHTINEICSRERITSTTFQQWTDEFLRNEQNKDPLDLKFRKKLSDDEKFRIVIEGKTGETSIAEICHREHITHDTFLEWSREFLELRKNKIEAFREGKSIYNKNKLLFSKISNLKIFNYLENYIDFSNSNQLVLLKSNSIRLDKVEDCIESIICLQKINDIRHINKYFERINAKLEIDGIFSGCLETFTARRQRLFIDRIPVINTLYFGFEFLVKRILPKLSYSKKVYFNVTKGRGRLLSKAEGLGRLVSSGFKIMDYKSIDGLIYFVVKKEKEPTFDLNPSYGPVYKMPRIGKNNKIIDVYKLRTMHPYSEYLQDYVLRANGYAKTGKPAADFRIPVWGKFMRRFWIDEIPQLINVLKGDMKLVGIRPVSKRYFQDIPKEMQKLRLTQKPGCIPPYVALNREGNVMSVLQAEKDYLEEKIRNPYSTDLKYFFKAIYNIVFKHKRSA